MRLRRQTGSHLWHPTGLLAQEFGGNTYKSHADGEDTLDFRAVTEQRGGLPRTLFRAGGARHPSGHRGARPKSALGQLAPGS